MKIGMFTDSYRPYTSGVVRSIETVAAKLTELGHEVYIFAPNYPHCEKEARIFRFLSVPAPTYPEFTIALPFSLSLRSTIKRVGLDVIHVHSPFSLGLLGARYARRCRLPLVFTYHTMYDQYVHYLPFGHEISRKIVNKLSQDFCNRCDVVITPTNIIKEIVGKNLNTRVEAIPTGIEIEEFANPDKDWLRSYLGIDRDTKILLHLGRMGKEKNIGFLLEAYKIIRNKLPRTCLVIAGDGPEKENLEKMSEQMGLKESVYFTGALPRKKVVDSYAGSDLFVFASTTETQGLVLGEAKAAGLPAVAVRALGAAEMVKDGVDGFLTTLSLEEFVSKVLLLLTDDDLRREMGKRALAEAENISSAKMAQKLACLYEELVQDKKRQFSTI